MGTAKRRAALAPPSGVSEDELGSFLMPRPSFVIRFDEHTNYPGAAVRCRRKLPLGDLLSYQQATEGEPEAGNELVMHRHFATYFIIEWNLRDPKTKEPIPVSADTFSAMAHDFTRPLLARWFAGIATVPAPLSQPPGAGTPSAAPSPTTDTA